MTPAFRTQREIGSPDQRGKVAAATILKAHISLKADVSAAGEGRSDSRIVAALDVSLATVARTRKRLVEEGFEAVLTRKHFPQLRSQAHLRRAPQKPS